MIDDLQETVSFGKAVTGIEHTIFIAPHAVLVAIDPVDGLNPQATITTTISIDGEVVVGDIEPLLLQRVREFIGRNRRVLVDHWSYKIDGNQLHQRLKP